MDSYSDEEGSEDYVINKIISQKGDEYLVLWEGYETDKPTWHTEDELYDLGTINLKKALAEFNAKQAEKKAEAQKKQDLNSVRDLIPAGGKGPEKMFETLDDSALGATGSLWAPWHMNHLRYLDKIPKIYVFRLIYMCDEKFLVKHSLDSRSAQKMPKEKFLTIYRQWTTLINMVPIESVVQPMYFRPSGDSTHITDLPGDALFTTFMFLSDLRHIIACDQSCKFFNRVLSDGRLWKPVYLSCSSPPTATTLAYFKGNYRELFFRLLEEWGRPATTRKMATRLCVATRNYRNTEKDARMLFKLLDKGIDPNFPGKHTIPMAIALHSCDFSLIKILMEYGGNASLLSSVKHTFPEEVQSLIDDSLNAATKEHEGRRYLRRAGWKNRFKNGFNFTLNHNLYKD